LQGMVAKATGLHACSPTPSQISIDILL